MYISKFKNNIVTLKLISLLLFLILLWLANLIIPVHTYHPIAYSMIYPFRALFIYYSIAIAFSVYIIKKRKCKIGSHDLIIAFILGALGGSTDIFLAITTILTYISSSIILSDSKTKITFLKIPIKDPSYIILIIVMLYIIFYIRFNNFGLVPVSYGIYRAVRPGITEEVMWRFFLFAVSMKITNGEFSNKYHKILIWLILIVPHILIHEPSNYSGLNHPINYISISRFISLILPATILTWAFLKLGLLCAILVHIFINAYGFSLTLYKMGDNIFYYIQPSILEVVFGL